MTKTRPLVVPTTTPRNHLVAPCLRRSGAGSHRKAHKALRQQAKAAVRKGEW